MGQIEYSGTTLAATAIVLCVFTLVIFALRLWFRITRRKFDASDAFLIAAVFCGIAQTTLYLVLVFGFDQGKLKKDIPLAIRTSKWPTKLLYANQIVFKLTTPLCKLSLCLLYRKICAASTGRLIERTRIAIWATIILIGGVYTSALLVSVFQCVPIHKAWDPKTPGSCINPTSFRYSTAVFNLITSVIIITIPIPMLLKLKHQRPEIKQLLGLILLGLMHTSLTFGRLVYMFYPDALIKSEPQYGNVPTQTLAVAEMDANILFASLVVMRPAFQALYYGLCSRCISHGTALKTEGIGYVENGLKIISKGKHRRGLSETYILEKTASNDSDSDSVVDLEKTGGHICNGMTEGRGRES